MDSVADLIFHEVGGEYFGGPIVFIPDFNGDGFSDILIGDGSYLNYAGKVYIYLGGSLMDNQADWTRQGEAEWIYYTGGNISSLDDLNGDGYSDIIIGSGLYPGKPDYRGNIQIYFGGAPPDTIYDVSIGGAHTNDYFGSCLSGAGNFNGDGCCDILVGAPGRNYAHIYFGGAIIDAIPDVLIIGDPFFDRYFGSSVACAGDVNGDGYDDVIIGDWAAYGYLGWVQLFLGGPNMDSKPDLFLIGWHEASAFGTSVASAGDVNGDGWPDIITGEWDGQFEAGAIELFLGSAHINYTADWLCGGVGYSVDGAGDVNGDGYDDLITSSVTRPFTHVATGRVYIFAGKPGLTDIGTSVEQITEKNLSPTQILFQNYPNPFNSQTSIRYLIANKFGKYVSLNIFDITGKEVSTLVDAWQEPAEYEVSWQGTNQNGKEVNSGMYLAHLSVGHSYQVKKLILIR